MLNYFEILWLLSRQLLLMYSSEGTRAVSHRYHTIALWHWYHTPVLYFNRKRFVVLDKVPGIPLPAPQLQ